MAVLLGSVVTIVTTALVNALFLRNEIKNRYKEAAKAIIKSKDVNVVYVDVYNQDNKKIQELEKRIRKKANKKLFGTTGVSIPISRARDELYYELKNIWYGNAV